jgi:hypothetical protein
MIYFSDFVQPFIVGSYYYFSSSDINRTKKAEESRAGAGESKEE